jgi:hypothetical protein
MAFKYTHEQLKEAGIGTALKTRSREWTKKKQIYCELGLWDEYVRIREGYREKFCDKETGEGDHALANRTAQHDIDKMIRKMLNGEQVPVGRDLKSSKPARKEDDRFVPAEELPEFNGELNLREDFMWVYQNLLIEDPDYKSAPSPGAAAYLKHCRKNSDNMAEFYNKNLPKILPKETDKAKDYHDDGRPTIELIERLQAEGQGDSQF